MRVLSIGNSFSEDATAYLHQIAETAGEEIETVNLFIGGCSLERHWTNLCTEAEPYLKLVNGTNTGEYVTIRQMLADGYWDFITLQQASHESFNYSRYMPFLTDLADELRRNAQFGELALHQTWAYEDGSSKLADMGYPTHQAMFADIRESYAKAAESAGITRMIPSGQVFAAMLKDGIGKIHRDTFHALIPFGRYALGLVWFESLTGKSCAAVSYVPEGMCRELAEAAGTMVHRYLTEGC